MGWFIRKSIRLGPVRFNLSKSGIGTSIGVRGLRVGQDARGRGYVFGGRGGIYFRQRLSQTDGGGGVVWWAVVATALVALALLIAFVVR